MSFWIVNVYTTLIHTTHHIFHTEIADDHADNKETGDHDDKKDAKGSTDRGYFLKKKVV